MASESDASTAKVALSAPDVRASRRSVPAMLFGLLLIVGAVVAFRVLDEVNTPPERTLLVLDRAVLPGEDITGDDIREVRINGGSTIAALSPSDWAGIGSAVAVDQLDEGTVLQRTMFFDTGELPADSAVVAILMRRGQSPVLRQGDPVALVQSTSDGPVSYGAIVKSYEDEGSEVLITARVDLDQAPTIAIAGAAGELTVIRLPTPSTSTTSVS